MSLWKCIPRSCKGSCLSSLQIQLNCKQSTRAGINPYSLSHSLPMTETQCMFIRWSKEEINVSNSQVLNFHETSTSSTTEESRLQIPLGFEKDIEQILLIKSRWTLQIPAEDRLLFQIHGGSISQKAAEYSNLNSYPLSQKQNENKLPGPTEGKWPWSLVNVAQ